MADWENSSSPRWLNEWDEYKRKELERDLKDGEIGYSGYLQASKKLRDLKRKHPEWD